MQNIHGVTSIDIHRLKLILSALVIMLLVSTVLLMIPEETSGDSGDMDPLWNHAMGDKSWRTDISADGKYLVVGSDDNKIYFFEQGSSTPLWSYTCDDDVTSVAISDDGEYIAGGCRDNYILFFHKDSDTPLWSYNIHKDDWGSGLVLGLDLSADGGYLIAGCGNDRAYFFDTDSSDPLWTYTSGSNVDSTSISADGTYIAVGSCDKKVYFFHKDSDDPQWSYTAGNRVRGVAVSANGEYIAVSSQDQNVYLFDKDSSTPLWSYTTGDEARVVSISADGEYIVAGSEDGKAYLFDKDSSTPLWIYNAGGELPCVDISSDGKYIIAGGTEAKVYFFDKDSNNPIWISSLGNDVSWASLSADGGKYGVVVSLDNQISFFDMMRPIGDIDTITPNPVVEGVEVHFKGHGTTLRDEITTYAWSSSHDGEFYNGTESEVSYSKLSVGTHTISFKVQDNHGAWSNEVSMMVQVHTQPTATIDSISPNPALPSESVEFSGSGDDDGTIERYVWTSSLDGELHNSTGASFSTSTLSKGEHSISFKAQDNHGAWSHAVSAIVKIGSPPTAVIDEITPTPSPEGKEIEFYGNGSDDDGIIDIYEWQSDIDGVIGTEPAFISSSLSVGTHTITFKVKDNDDFWSDLATQKIEISNVLPVATITNITPLKPLETETITFEGQVDERGSVIAYLWQSDVEGELDTNATFSMVLSPGLHTISFSAQDDEEVWSDPVSELLWVNDVPTASITPGHPNVVNEGAEITIEGSGEDLGKIQGYLWKSSIDGELSATAVLKTATLSVGTHTITFKVMDNDTIWSDEVNVKITINALPQALAGTNIHSFPHIDVQFSGQGADPDGEIVKYEWDFDGNGIYEWSSTESGLTKYTYNNPGEFNAVFRVTDNHGAQVTDSLYVTVNMNVSEEGGETGFMPGFTALPVMASIGIAGALVAFFRKQH